MMNYGDLKRVVLQKVFAITDGVVITDDATQEYLTALPGAANEGLQLLATAGRFLKRKLLIHQVAEEELPTDGEPKDNELYRATGAGQNDYDLSELLLDFYSLNADGVYYSPKGGRQYRQGDWAMQGGQVLLLPAEAEGTWTIWYNAYPPVLTSETEDDYELPLYPEVAALLPLYIASQIYKDDDIALATQYRNEFEVGREALLSSEVRGIQGNESWHSASGWWDYGE